MGTRRLSWVWGLALASLSGAAACQAIAGLSSLETYPVGTGGQGGVVADGGGGAGGTGAAGGAAGGGGAGGGAAVCTASGDCPVGSLCPNAPPGMENAERMCEPCGYTPETKPCDTSCPAFGTVPVSCMNQPEHHRCVYDCTTTPCTGMLSLGGMGMPPEHELEVACGADNCNGLAVNCAGPFACKVTCTGACDGLQISCGPDGPCELVCDGPGACNGATKPRLSCGQNDCTTTCTGNTANVTATEPSPDQCPRTNNGCTP